MALSTYLALMTGFLSGTLGNFIGGIISSDSLQVTVYGARTDVFWNTSVDRVYVTNPHGLVVDVRDARVEGALHGYLVFRHVRRVTVGDLLITIPEPRADGRRSTLIEILDNIDRGIVTGADSLTLLDGTISDSAGPILDDMRLTGSVSRGDGAHVTAARVSTWIRNVGMVSGSGQASIEDRVVTSRGFSGSTPFGNIYFEGSLVGETAAVDISFSGAAKLDRPEIPLTVEMDVEGTATGTLQAPAISTVIRNGVASIYDHPLEFSADTLIATLDSIALVDLQLAGEGLRLSTDCGLRFSDFLWRASGTVLMEDFEPSELASGAPEAILNGSLTAAFEGTGVEQPSGSIRMELRNSSFSGFPVTSLQASATTVPGRWTLAADAASPGLSATVEASGTSGADMIPYVYSGRLGFTVADASLLPVVVLPESVSVLGVSGTLAFAGTRSGFSAEGVAEAATILGPGGLHAEGTTIEGTAAIAGAPRGSLLLAIDSLYTPLDTFSAAATLEFGDGEYVLSGFEAVSADGIRIDAGAMYRIGDPDRLLIEGLRIGSSKQRIITDGSIACSFDSSAVLIDTAWVQTPHGLLSLRGAMDGGISSFDLSGRHLDLSQLGGLLHLQSGISGMGEFSVRMDTGEDGSSAQLDGRILGPTFGAYQADSIILDLDLVGRDLVVTGISSWDEGTPSTFTALVEDFRTEDGFSLLPGNIARAELILNSLGDWVFYALPIPLRTRGADISARLEYSRDAPPGRRITMEAVASIERLFITSLDMYLSNVVMHLQPDTALSRTRLTLSSADSSRGTIMASLLLDIDQDSLPALNLDGYEFRADFDSFRASVGGFANILFSGYLQSEGGDPSVSKPLVTGKIEILEGVIGMPPSVESGGAAAPEPLPVDLRISIRGNRGLWFRSSLADIEMILDLTVLSQQDMPALSGTLTSVRGKVHLLQKDFDITSGLVEFLPGVPSEQRLSITAVTEVRGAVDRASYTITVNIQGSPSSPVITLSGEGPLGSLTQEDILSLLAVGITYGELQQMDSGALQMQLGGAAQSYIGQILARSLREGIGLDQLELTPELLSDSTSLTLNVGKYVLPDLFVSFSGDVFSSEPGTISAQYYIQPDLYLVGSTKSTLHGEQEPSIELHYTLRY